ncbi:MAG: hypothetical protein SXG53_22510 [Pseudomonadota bacterium]|nr:hypothetical protein [Pseudomonadota bacterium]
MNIASLQFTPSQAQRWLGARASPAMRSIAIVALIAVLASGCWVGWQCLEDFAELRKETDRTGELRQRLDELQARARRPVQLHTKEQLAEYNRVTRNLNTPWAAIFALLERRIPRDVALISIEPDAARRIVRLQAEARTLDDLIQCAESLRKDPSVARVLPIQHDTNEQDPSRPLRLMLELTMQEAR